MTKEKRQSREMSCGCFWNGGHWIRLCDKCLEGVKKQLAVDFDKIVINKQTNEVAELKIQSMPAMRSDNLPEQ